MTGLLCAVLLGVAVLVWPGGGSVGGRARIPVTLRRGVPRPGHESQSVLLQVLEAVAGQVRGGAEPSVAWDAAVEVIGPPADHLPRARGAPLDAALRAAWPGDPCVLSVAAAWQLAHEVGAPLADVLDQLAAGLRAEAEVDAEIEASLAAPRATARLLAGLPLAGLGLGELIGAGPLRVLVGTTIGRLAALAGLAFALVGHLWSRGLVARAAATR